MKDKALNTAPRSKASIPSGTPRNQKTNMKAGSVSRGSKGTVKFKTKKV